MRLHLTPTRLTTLKPQQQDYFVWDTHLNGYGVRVLPSGTLAFVVQCRTGDRTRRHTLGRFPALTEAEARTQALAFFQGRNPVPGQPTITAIPFPVFAEEFFIRYARHWKPRTLTLSRFYYEKELLPVFGEMSVHAITRADVMRWFNALASRSAVANRTLPILSVMLREAEHYGYRTVNSQPCARIQRYKRPQVERYLSHPELLRLARILTRQAGDQPFRVALVRTLLFTGCRVGELLNVRWVDLREGHLHLQDSKTGPRTVYLSPSAHRLIDALPRLDAHVFPHQQRGGPMTYKQMSAYWRKLREAAGLTDVRLHDLRHTYASIGLQAGVHLVVLSRLLGHALTESTLRYAHLDTGHLQGASEAVSGVVAQHLAAGGEGR